MIGTLEQAVAKLLNIAAQKLLKIAKESMRKQESGYDPDQEFCDLTRIQAVIFRLQKGGDVSIKDVECIEEILIGIGGYGNISVRPVALQPTVQILKPSCCDNAEILDRISILGSQVNYQKPTLKLTSSIEIPEIEEVGFGELITNIHWQANKLALDGVKIDTPDGQLISPNAIGTHNNLSVDLGGGVPVTRRFHGYYNDATAYNNVHLSTEDELCYKTVWPFYFGIAPKDSMDNETTAMAFVRSLDRLFEFPEEIDSDITDGNVLWFFYPGHKAYEFKTESGIIAGSFKGYIPDFKTESMVNNNIDGGMQYGVIRTDQQGVRYFKAKFVEAFAGLMRVQPNDFVEIVPTPEPDIISYEGVWTNLVCVKETV